jgi:hypothetical protein
LVGDHVIADWKEAGLFFPSLVTGIARTIKQAMVARKLGALSKRDLVSTEKGMHRSLGL